MINKKDISAPALTFLLVIASLVVTGVADKLLLATEEVQAQNLVSEHSVEELEAEAVMNKLMIAAIKVEREANEQTVLNEIETEIETGAKEVSEASEVVAAKTITSAPTPTPSPTPSPALAVVSVAEDKASALADELAAQKLAIQVAEAERAAQEAARLAAARAAQEEAARLAAEQAAAEAARLAEASRTSRSSRAS